MKLQFDDIPLDKALFLSGCSREHSTLASSTSAQALSDDKQLVGALDSACNRTCAGPSWLDGYVRKLQQVAPLWVLELVDSSDEQENFRFGNGGLVTSSKRWRLPTLICGRIVLIWVSIVPVLSLGCLLGRDFLDAVGGILNFASKTLQCSFLSTASQRLNQMNAGHFMFPLIGEDWPRQRAGRWRTCGLDGIVELQIDPQSWLNRRLSENFTAMAGESHDQLVTEGLVERGRTHEILLLDHLPAAQAMTAATATAPFPQLPLRHLADRDGASGECHPDSGASCSEAAHVRMPTGVRNLPLAPIHLATSRSRPVACSRIAALVGLAILFEVLALSIPFNHFCGGLEGSGQGHGEPIDTERSCLQHGRSDWEVHCSEPFGAVPLQGSCGLATCLPGGLTTDWLSGGSWNEGSCQEDPRCCIGRSSPGSCSTRQCEGAGRVCPTDAGPEVDCPA